MWSSVTMNPTDQHEEEERGQGGHRDHRREDQVCAHDTIFGGGALNEQEYSTAVGVLRGQCSLTAKQKQEYFARDARYPAIMSLRPRP